MCPKDEDKITHGRQIPVGDSDNMHKAYFGILQIRRLNRGSDYDSFSLATRFVAP